jgi:hypothetical protein
VGFEALWNLLQQILELGRGFRKTPPVIRRNSSLKLMIEFLFMIGSAGPSLSD